MKTCAHPTCSKPFEKSTARVFYGRGHGIRNSKFCSTECREVARIGRRRYEGRKAKLAATTADSDAGAA